MCNLEDDFRPMQFKKQFPFYRQLDARDCGPACLRMISRFYGRDYSMETLRELSYITREGVSLLGLKEAAESLGYQSVGVFITLDQLISEAPLPCILHWNENHFVVLYDVKGDNHFYISDPAHGRVKLSRNDFLRSWSRGETQGYALLLETTDAFYQAGGEKVKRRNVSYILKYLEKFRLKLVLLIFLILAAGAVQFVFPLLTQRIVDTGIANRDPSFVQMILWGLFVLLISRTLFDFLRNWLLLLVSTRVNIALISDFLGKLMRLPVKFFESRFTGDILQRIWDHSRIQYFLTYASLSVIYGVFSLIVFSVFLAFYSLPILGVFLAGSLIYFIWIRFFMKKRLYLEYQRFSRLSDNQNSLYEIITGMQEIRLNNCEQIKRKRWEHIQEALYSIGLKNLRITQYQQVGGLFFNESKNLLITGLSAYAVINGQMSIGMMVAVQYIIGQMNGPVDQMIGLMQAGQDARISLERFIEVHDRKDEEAEGSPELRDLPEDTGFTLRDVVFHYEGPNSPKVLDQISLTIPRGKITAIVGPSGSGKTTLIKLLLGVYAPWSGEIKVGGTELNTIRKKAYRAACGTVMQDGFIFSDTIKGNIAPAETEPDMERVRQAASVANILDFIQDLPRGFETRIGQEGSGISQGQRQRILIARAVYKNPPVLFFDEATNALDAENEHVIMENMKLFFRNRTVVIVAHRLSTVKNADQIVVLDKGKIAETGTHTELLERKGMYHNLVKNQLDLD